MVILYAAGRSASAIRRRLGVTPKQIQRTVEAAVRLRLVEPRPKRDRWTDEEALAVCRAREREGVIGAAAKLGMSTDLVRSGLRITRARRLRPARSEG